MERLQGRGVLVTASESMFFKEKVEAGEGKGEKKRSFPT